MTFTDHIEKLIGILSCYQTSGRYCDSDKLTLADINSIVARELGKSL